MIFIIPERRKIKLRRIRPDSAAAGLMLSNMASTPWAASGQKSVCESAHQVPPTRGASDWRLIWGGSNSCTGRHTSCDQLSELVVIGRGHPNGRSRHGGTLVRWQDG